MYGAEPQGRCYATSTQARDSQVKHVSFLAFTALITESWITAGIYGNRFAFLWNISNGCYMFFKIFFVGPRSILWGHWLPLCWTLCHPSHGFQSQDGSFPCTLTCLRVVNLRATSGATPAFSTSRGVHCISVCSAGPPCGTSPHVLHVQYLNEYAIKFCFFSFR